MSNDIKLGRKIISKVFDGNPYKQLSLIRQGIWALAVLNDNIDGDKLKAQEILDKLEDFNSLVEELIK